MGEDCKGRCHYQNHLEHDDGRCCAHESRRVVALMPQSLKELVDARCERLRMTRGEWVRSALQMFGARVEEKIDPREPSARVEVSLPLYLCGWIETRDPLYVARRISAFFANEAKS